MRILNYGTKASLMTIEAGRLAPTLTVQIHLFYIINGILVLSADCLILICKGVFIRIYSSILGKIIWISIKYLFRL